MGIEISTFPFQFYISILICLFFLLILGFTSIAEVAFFSLSQEDIEKLTEKKRNTFIRLKNKQEHVFYSLIFIKTLLYITIVSLIVYSFNNLLQINLFSKLNFLLSTLIIGFSMLLFGEIIPKIYATYHTKKIVNKSIFCFLLLIKIFLPFSYLLFFLSEKTNKHIFKYSKKKLSIDDLSQALENNPEKIEEEKELLEGIIKFSNINVEDVMTSRVNTVDLEINTTYLDVIKKISTHEYSRMPVYKDSLDNIKGILYIKDLLAHLNKGDSFRWQTLIRPAYFVPKNKKINDLLEEFQKSKIHMAIVVDEFGGTSGIITMEDILEEIVGDISDEYDEEDNLFSQINNHTFIFEAKILLHDFFKIKEIEEEQFTEIKDEAETLAGMILKITGEIPKEKEKIEYKNYIFEIIKADNRKIEKIKLHILQHE